MGNITKHDDPSLTVRTVYVLRVDVLLHNPRSSAALLSESAWISSQTDVLTFFFPRIHVSGISFYPTTYTLLRSAAPQFVRISSVTENIAPWSCHTRPTSECLAPWLPKSCIPGATSSCQLHLESHKVVVLCRTFLHDCTLQICCPP